MREELQERFGVEVSKGHVNHVRAELGVQRPKKNADPIEVEWRESAGSLLLLAGSEETGLLPELVEAVPTDTECERLAQGTVESQQQLMQTLLFLGTAGLQRPWELRSYTGDGLALLTGRERAFGYVHTERFLSQLAQADGDGPLTEAVALWSYELWEPDETMQYYILSAIYVYPCFSRADQNAYRPLRIELLMNRPRLFRQG